MKNNGDGEATIGLENQNENLLPFRFHTDFFSITLLLPPSHKQNFTKVENEPN